MERLDISRVLNQANDIVWNAKGRKEDDVIIGKPAVRTSQTGNSLFLIACAQLA